MRAVNRKHIILPIFHDLLWNCKPALMPSFKNTHTTACLFSEGRRGILLHNVLIALPLAQAFCWATCLHLLHLCLHILWDHSEPCWRSLQLLSRPGPKKSKQSPSHPAQLLPRAYPRQKAPSTNILMQHLRQEIPSMENFSLKTMDSKGNW